MGRKNRHRNVLKRARIARREQIDRRIDWLDSAINFLQVTAIAIWYSGVNESNWQAYNGDYEKQEYDIITKHGQVFRRCWPNAGTFHVSWGPPDYPGQKVGTVIDGRDVAYIRVNEDYGREAG